MCAFTHNLNICVCSCTLLWVYAELESIRNHNSCKFCNTASGENADDCRFIDSGEMVQIVSAVICAWAMLFTATLIHIYTHICAFIAVEDFVIVPTRQISPKQIFCYFTSELLILLLHTVVSLHVWCCSSNWMFPAKIHTYAKVYLRATYTHTYICIPRILLCRALIRHGRQSLVEAVVLPFSLTLLRTTTYEYVCYFHFSLCHQKHLWLHLPKCVCMRVKACEIIKCEVQLFSLWQSENCVWQQIYFESRYFICATLTSSRQQLWLVVILLNDYTFAYEKVDFTRLIERDGVAKIM